MIETNYIFAVLQLKEKIYLPSKVLLGFWILSEEVFAHNFNSNFFRFLRSGKIVEKFTIFVTLSNSLSCSNPCIRLRKNLSLTYLSSSKRIHHSVLFLRFDLDSTFFALQLTTTWSQGVGNLLGEIP